MNQGGLDSVLTPELAGSQKPFLSWALRRESSKEIPNEGGGFLNPPAEVYIRLARMSIDPSKAGAK